VLPASKLSTLFNFDQLYSTLDGVFVFLKVSLFALFGLLGQFGQDFFLIAPIHDLVLPAILPANLPIIEIPRESREGDKPIFENIGFFPKGPRFSQGDKKFRGVRGQRDKGDQLRPPSGARNQGRRR
jgi:hypothetical protein